jgi:hypothetical protein
MIEMFKSTAGALLQVMLEVCTTPLALPVALAILWRSYSRTLTVGAIPWAFCVAVLATFVFGGVAPSFLDMQQAPLKYWLRPLNDKPETQEMVRSWVSSKVLLPRTAAFAFAFFAVILIDYRKWKWSQWVGLYVVMTLTITALTFLIYFLVAIFTVPMRLDELRKFDAN